MDGVTSLQHILDRASRLAPAGYALTLHFEYAAPRFMISTYPAAWMDHYSRNGLMMKDPVIAWGIRHEGISRWSDLPDLPGGVFEQARSHGLVYGATSALNAGGSRTIANFARADREFTDGEMSDITDIVGQVHAMTAPGVTLSREDKALLEFLSQDAVYA